MQYFHLFHLEILEYYFGYITINNGDMIYFNNLLMAGIYLNETQEHVNVYYIISILIMILIFPISHYNHL